MKKTIIIYGLIAGTIVTAWMLVAMAGLYNAEGSLLLGYTTMIVAFSLIFVSVKNYRDKQNGGIITFGKALQIGLLITAIASTIYVVVWLIDYYYFIPDFYEKYSTRLLAKMRADGAGPLEIKKQVEEIQKYARLYKNPFFNALVTYSEILPVGLTVSFLCALILKRKQTADSLAISN